MSTTKLIPYQKISSMTGEKLLTLMYENHIITVAKEIIKILKLSEKEKERILTHIKDDTNNIICMREFKNIYKTLNPKKPKKPLPLPLPDTKDDTETSSDDDS